MSSSEYTHHPNKEKKTAACRSQSNEHRSNIPKVSKVTYDELVMLYDKFDDVGVTGWLHLSKTQPLGSDSIKPRKSYRLDSRRLSPPRGGVANKAVVARLHPITIRLNRLFPLASPKGEATINNQTFNFHN
ncbi:hypothetical protein ACMFMG_008315 [Clarireedia jacksonii]